MIARVLASHSPRAVREALVARGWETVKAETASDGMRPAAVEVSGLDEATLLALVRHSSTLGLDISTGDDWAVVGGSSARLSALARPWVVPEALAELANQVGRALPAELPATWSTARGQIAVDQPVIFGILNITPDSFSDGGKFLSPDAALTQADQLLTDGAHVFDVGGESTRPGSESVPAEVELSRVRPIVEALVKRHPSIPVSVDTVKSEVARVALDAGAAIINDVSAFRLDTGMGPVAARGRAGVILMHSRGTVSTMARLDHADYTPDVVSGVTGELAGSLDRAITAGVGVDHIVLDPGFGFAKTAEQNLLLLDQLPALRQLGRPLLVGPSRKRFLGSVTGREVGERDVATASACVLAYERGARLFRVHNVAVTRDALAVAVAVRGRKGDPSGRPYEPRTASQRNTNIYSIPMPRRPPYGLAALASLVVLTGYVISLAPTVTFWDAGEFIAAAKSLGIPHPPGTPLFVMIGHVWGTLLPFGEFAQRTNLLSATLSALGAGCFFLVIHDVLGRYSHDLQGSAEQVIRIGGAFAAVVIAGFTFTTWQNSNETEVYAAATFTIAAMSWLCLRWRDLRGTARASHTLLLILYLAGISIGNHLLALLAGPAVVAFIVATLLERPAADSAERSAEWAQAAVVAGTWALLIGSGLGSTTLVTLGGVCYLAAAGFAVYAGSLPFALLALVISSIGVTSYLYLYIRSGLHPPINEAAPDNWKSLLAVIRREQYPVRTPLDDPTILHGPDNPGRSFKIFGLQLVNYIQYFDWQWANGVTAMLGWFPVRTIATLLFSVLGLHGLVTHRRTDRPTWWLLFMLWLVTGLGLVVYMNFKPGYSMAYDQYPQQADHEVRDRDYFFVVSYAVWGLWAGIGLTAMVRAGMERLKAAAALMAIPLGLIAITPAVGNFEAAGRRHGPDARLAADFAYDLLNSVPPYGILFTYGDNDTFPLWWAQEVQGIRQDVLVVCLALTETDWYKRQLRDFPVRPFDEASAPKIWQGRNPQMPTWKAHSMTDEQIQAAAQPRLLPADLTVQIGPITHTLRKGTPVYSHDYAVIRILQDNLGRRPISWSLTTGGDYYGLNDYVLQQGLAMQLQTAKVDTTRRDVDVHRVLGVPLDLPTTERLIWETYRYAGLGVSTSTALEPTARGVAGNLALPFAQMAYAYQGLGLRDSALKNVERASALSPNPSLKRALLNVLTQPGGDSAVRK